MINYLYFKNSIEEAKAFESADCFAANHGHPLECPYDENGLMRLCTLIWAAAHSDMNTLIDLTTGGNLSQFARMYGLPIRTVQNWQRGERNPPDYMLPLLAYAIAAEIPETLTNNDK